MTDDWVCSEIGQVAGHNERHPWRKDVLEGNRARIALDHAQPGCRAEPPREVRNHSRLNFEGNDRPALLEQHFRQLSGPGANLKDEPAGRQFDRRDDVRKYTGIAQEMLAERFPRPGPGKRVGGINPMLGARGHLSRGCRYRRYRLARGSPRPIPGSQGSPSTP